MLASVRIYSMILNSKWLPLNAHAITIAVLLCLY